MPFSCGKCVVVWAWSLCHAKIAELGHISVLLSLVKCTTFTNYRTIGAPFSCRVRINGHRDNNLHLRNEDAGSFALTPRKRLNNKYDSGRPNQIVNKRSWCFPRRRLFLFIKQKFYCFRLTWRGAFYAHGMKENDACGMRCSVVACCFLVSLCTGRQLKDRATSSHCLFSLACLIIKFSRF